MSFLEYAWLKHQLGTLRILIKWGISNTSEWAHSNLEKLTNNTPITFLKLVSRSSQEMR